MLRDRSNAEKTNYGATSRRDHGHEDREDSEDFSLHFESLDLGSDRGRGSDSASYQEVHTGYLEVVEIKSDCSYRGGAHDEDRAGGHGHGDGAGGGTGGGYYQDDDYDDHADYYDGGYEGYDDGDDSDYEYDY